MSETASAPAAPSTQSEISQDKIPIGTDNSGLSHGKGIPDKEKIPIGTGQEFFDVKVNGKMVKMTKQEALDNASMSYAANDKFNEAAKLRKQVDSILNKAKTNPIEALMDPSLGLTKDQIREAFEKWYTTEYIEPESLNEDQKRAREYEIKLKKYEEQERLAKEKAARDEDERLTSQQRDYLQGQIIEAMEASGLPKTKFFVSRMAFYMRQNALNGWDAPINLIVKQVQNERQAMMGDMSDGATPEQLVALLGETASQKINAYYLKQLRDKRGQFAPPATNNPRAGTGPLDGDKISSSEVTRRLREMRMGKL